MAALHPGAAPSSSSDELFFLTSLKRKRDETNLVLCFAHNDVTGANPVLYTFQSHPIERFITKSDQSHPIERFITKSDTPSKLEPVSQFVWKEVLDDEYKKLLYSPDYPHWRSILQKPYRRTLVPPYLSMHFLNAGDFIYAVGGQRISQDRFFNVEEDLPTDFVRIHLSPSLQKSRVELETLTQMPTRKFVGGIAEIGGRIYVISSPYHRYRKLVTYSFEVYDPSNNGWISLPEPPFLLATDRKNLRSGDKVLWGTLTCFVMDAKLYVSSYHYSSVYDPNLNAWEACTIFSDDAWEACTIFSDFFDPIPLCGPPFPFDVNPVVFKEKFCVVPTHKTHTPIVAYHISTGNVKQIKFEGLPFGHIRNPLVDLGDDCFLAMVYEYPPFRDPDDHTVDDEDHVAAVTFKLMEEKETHGDNDSASILKATMISVHQIYSSFDLQLTEVKEGGEVAMSSERLPSTLVSAFLQHSSSN